MNIRLSGIEKESIVDGPGIRYVIFAQGCSHKCKGCHNPQTHDFNGGYLMDINLIYNDIISKEYINGVTFSGGDPFFQAEEFSCLAEKLKAKNINIMAYTGFLYENLLLDSSKKRLLNNIDILIDGPFINEEKTLSIPFRGSSNQRAINVPNSLCKNKLVLYNFMR